MKRNISLSILLLAAFSTPTFAHDNQDAQECLAKSKSVSGMHEQVKFLTKCLREIDPTAFRMGERVERCNQNATNKKLEGAKRDEYLEQCYFPKEVGPKSSK